MNKGVKKGKAPLKQAVTRKMAKQSTVRRSAHKKKAAFPQAKSNAVETNLEEPQILYNKSSIGRWLGGSEYLDKDIRNDFDVIGVGMAGITKASIDELTAYIGVSKKNMAEEILNISIKTLERKQPEDKLDKRTSSHVLEVAKLMQHAFDVFEEEQKAKHWLNSENRALNRLRPVQLLSTLTGINMVNDVLTRIEEGVYS